MKSLLHDQQNATRTPRWHFRRQIWTAAVFTQLLLMMTMPNQLSAAEAARPLARPKAIFASADIARQMLTAHDEYVNHLRPFDRSIRMQTNRNVTEQEYLLFVSKSVLNWSDQDRKTVASAWNAVSSRLGDISARLPPTVIFIETNGKEEGGASYTRANAIVLPQQFVREAARTQVEEVIAHELFHVLSRNNPNLRDRLYATIGFRPCGEISLPPELASRKISNPDAPKDDHCIKVESGGVPLWVAPILAYRYAQFDTSHSGPFVQNVELDFVVVERGNPSPANRAAAKPKVIDIRQTQGLFEQVGKNTSYIIHPEEVLADNFSYLVTGKAVASPEIPASISRVLRGK